MQCSTRSAPSETYRAIIVRPWRDRSIADERLMYSCEESGPDTRRFPPGVSFFVVQRRRDTEARRALARRACTMLPQRLKPDGYDSYRRHKCVKFHDIVYRTFRHILYTLVFQ